MSDLVEKLVCDNVKALTPYESARRLFATGDDTQSQQVWLNANESPFHNAFQVDDSRFNRYPDCQPSGLIKAYAKYAGTGIEQTLVTRGADEGIELLIRTFCNPRTDSILICPPTYGMYAISAQTCDVAVKKVPLKDNFSLDVEAICQHKDQVKLVFVCSPNNPTGTSVEKQQLRSLVEHFANSALVVVDEAYIEFDKENTWATELSRYPNLVILRTLSKAYALAGLRCGFTLASSPIIKALLKVIAPYPIPEPVAQIAQQALTEAGVDNMLKQVDYLAIQRNKLHRYLKTIKQVELVGDDKANFILFRTPLKSQLMQFLVEHNVFIRDQSKQLNLNNCLRITVGNDQQNQHLMDLITSFYNTQEIA
ncbi:histidinol-phosphate transaminase [Aliiglaciecola litoralis]|uniref:Histidinol-phosphate aminotransferase n=1 Tax=Aliiglaciecola litoralis TaxID=582857 RepID=A0ABN1LTD2_9ALTE